MARLKASTVIESMIAMTLLCIIICISSVSFVNSMKSGKTSIKFRAMLSINEEYQHSLQMKDIEDRQFFKDGIKLNKKVNKYPYYDDIYLVEYSCLDNNGDTIMKQNVLFNVDDE